MFTDTDTCLLSYLTTNQQLRYKTQLFHRFCAKSCKINVTKIQRRGKDISFVKRSVEVFSPMQPPEGHTYMLTETTTGDQIEGDA